MYLFIMVNIYLFMYLYIFIFIHNVFDLLDMYCMLVRACIHVCLFAYFMHCMLAYIYASPICCICCLYLHTFDLQQIFALSSASTLQVGENVLDELSALDAIRSHALSVILASKAIVQILFLMPCVLNCRLRG